jgi:hypothetical protein
MGRVSPRYSPYARYSCLAIGVDEENHNCLTVVEELMPTRMNNHMVLLELKSPYLTPVSRHPDSP